MEKAVSGNITGFIDRRLHGVRLGLSHLNKMLELLEEAVAAS